MKEANCSFFHQIICAFRKEGLRPTERNGIIMTKPAIILITCDELRRDSIGLYGNKAVPTPHLDKLAQSSMRYENCYTPSPLCLPARSAIATGLYPHNSGAYSNFRDCALKPELPNMFRLLKDGGYRTSMFGKCHFVPGQNNTSTASTTIKNDHKEKYLELGIDDLWLQDGKASSIWFYDDYSRELEAAGYLDAYRQKQWDKKTYASVFDFPGPAEYHPDIWVANKTCNYLQDYKQDEPLFMWLSFSGPHYPFDPPKEYLSRVDTTQLGERSFLEGEFDCSDRFHHTSYHGPAGIDACNRAKDGACKNFDEDYWTRLRTAYHANISLIDDQIGRVLDLVRQKFGDNALVIFTTDHGEMLGDHGLWGKHDCVYDPVWRTPLFVQYPNGELKGETATGKVSTLDILPTCLKATGIETDAKFDGNELRALTAAGGYPYVFAEAETFMAVTDGVYKYFHARFGGKGFHELLDLNSDPGEFVNYVNEPSHRDILVRLQQQIIERFVQDIMP